MIQIQAVSARATLENTINLIGREIPCYPRLPSDILIVNLYFNFSGNFHSLWEIAVGNKFFHPYLTQCYQHFKI